MKRIIIFALVCLLSVSMTGCKNSDYHNALALYEAGSYAEAEALLTQLGDYKDSVSLRLACRYGQAMELYEAESYEEAGKIFDKLGNYEDSPRMLKACHYARALALQKAKDYEAALELYMLAAGYEDSDSKILECRQKYVAQLMDNAQYDKALPHLKVLNKAGVLASDSNAIGWCTLAAFLKENRGFSSVQTYSFTIRLAQDDTIEILARLLDDKTTSTLYSATATTTAVDYSLKLKYNASTAAMTYSYNNQVEQTVGRTVKTAYDTESASATVKTADFTLNNLTWKNLQHEGMDLNKKEQTNPINFMTELELTKIFREMSVAFEKMELGITLWDLGFVSLAM